MIRITYHKEDDLLFSNLFQLNDFIIFITIDIKTFRYEIKRVLPDSFLYAYGQGKHLGDAKKQAKKKVKEMGIIIDDDLRNKLG